MCTKRGSERKCKVDIRVEHKVRQRSEDHGLQRKDGSAPLRK